MDAAALLSRLAEVIDAHDWDGLPELLHDDFTCRIVHTGEVFNRDAWVRLNAHYPGFESMRVEDLVAHGDRAVLRARVTGRSDVGEAIEHAVASFATVRDGSIADLVEVWSDMDQAAPQGTRP